MILLCRFGIPFLFILFIAIAAIIIFKDSRIVKWLYRKIFSPYEDPMKDSDYEYMKGEYDKLKNEHVKMKGTANEAVKKAQAELKKIKNLKI